MVLTLLLQLFWRHDCLLLQNFHRGLAHTKYCDPPLPTPTTIYLTTIDLVRSSTNGISEIMEVLADHRRLQVLAAPQQAFLPEAPEDLLLISNT